MTTLTLHRRLAQTSEVIENCTVQAASRAGGRPGILPPDVVVSLSADTALSAFDQVEIDGQMFELAATPDLAGEGLRVLLHKISPERAKPPAQHRREAARA